mmetsp:Transcript_64857/g.148904  ORF Transcript_64857/g.148904 Transcript_64857/m.148904 type:complete len:84 (+) Transcript_64857:1-252(+)
MVGAYSDDNLGEGSGAAYIFSATNGETNWTQSAKITPASGSAGDNFGRSVSGLVLTLLLQRRTLNTSEAEDIVYHTCKFFQTK